MVVTANNVAPTVNGGADKTVNEGSSVSLSAVGSDVGSLDTLSYLWHVVASNGQVIADKTGANFSFTALDNGTYTATVKVTDKDGGFSTDSVLVTVNNVAPVVSMSGDAALVPGQAGSYSGSFSDVGVLDTQQVMWNFGDGSIINWHSSKDASAMNVSHSWDKKGTYTVTMSVRDKDGAVSSTTQSVTVESKGQIKKDPNAGTVLVVGGSSVMTFLMPGTASSSTVLVAVDGKLQGVFNALDKIVAYDSDGQTRKEITMGGSMAGQVLSNVATSKLGARKLARAFRK
jgi:hypothetical protein